MAGYGTRAEHGTGLVAATEALYRRLWCTARRAGALATAHLSGWLVPKTAGHRFPGATQWRQWRHMKRITGSPGADMSLVTLPDSVTDAQIH